MAERPGPAGWRREPAGMGVGLGRAWAWGHRVGWTPLAGAKARPRVVSVGTCPSPHPACVAGPFLPASWGLLSTCLSFYKPSTTPLSP